MKFREYIDSSEDDLTLEEMIEEFDRLCQLDEKSVTVPKGWTKKSVNKYGKTLTGLDPKEHGFFDKCVASLPGEWSEDRKKAHCARLKDKAYGSTMWRGKGKPKEEVNKQTKAKHNISIKKSK